jgi:predicted enzyme related to lactoylglutathione lyase
MPEFSSYTHGTPCWVDVTSPDLAATHAFYAGLFGWEAQSLGEEAGGYTMYTLGGRRVAAAGPPPQEGVPPQWTTYLASDDADDTAARSRAAGGAVLAGPFDVFDSGRMAVAADPTGAVFGIWQAGTHHGAELANEPGTVIWNECHSPDPAAAAGFYETVFGYGIAESDLGANEPYRALQVGGRSVAGVQPTRGAEPPSWLTVFACARCDDAVARVRALGGDTLTEPFDIPDVGRFAVVADPPGAVFGLLSPPT